MQQCKRAMNSEVEEETLRRATESFWAISAGWVLVVVAVVVWWCPSGSGGRRTGSRVRPEQQRTWTCWGVAAVRRRPLRAAGGGGIGIPAVWWGREDDHRNLELKSPWRLPSAKLALR